MGAGGWGPFNPPQRLRPGELVVKRKTNQLLHCLPSDHGQGDLSAGNTKCPDFLLTNMLGGFEQDQRISK